MLRWNLTREPYRFISGYLLWMLLVFLAVGSMKGSFHYFGQAGWWKHVGNVYTVYGLLNFVILYALANGIIPHFLQRKQKILLALVTIVLLLGMGVVKYLVGKALFPQIFEDTTPEGKDYIVRFPHYLLKTFWTGFLVSLLGYAFRFSINWFKAEKHRNELEKQNLSSQLAFLRMQINPHFLFNTLNNIYSLSLDKSNEAPEAILKLSDMMRYMLYEKEDEHNMVPLEREVDYLRDFIELNKLRNREAFYVDFTVSGNFEHRRIPPLLLIPFVENAFKHGVVKDPQNPLSMHLVVAEDRLFFKVQNQKKILNKPPAGGIGMENVRQRLQLIYNGRHQLQVTENEQVYSCSLSLIL